MRPARVVSGGQTGVDRGALDAAMAAGRPCGGWCPAGRAAEDGAIPPRYPVVAIEAADPAVRTRRNAEDSDGTLVLCFGAPTGGTRFTVETCRELERPCLVVDASAVPVAEAARQARAFVERHDIETLNVAGPRESGWRDGCSYAREVIGRLLTGSE